MPAILIDCNAKGIPIIVMQRRKADAKCITANSQPMTKIQMILKIRLETLLEGEIDFPKGKSPKPAILKH